MAGDGTVVVVGSVNVDLVVRTATLPAPGETVVGGTFSSGPGGKGGNQAAAAARLGSRTVFVGRVGDDEFGRAARADLSAAGVDVSLLAVDPRAPTGVALIVVDDRGENLIAVASGANAEVTAGEAVAAVDAVHEGLRAQGTGARAVLLTNLEVPLQAATAAAVHAHRLGWAVVVNPAPARPLPDDLLAAVDVLTPNAGEAARLHPAGPAGLLAAGARCVLVTRGAQGVDLHVAGATAEHVPAVPVAVRDTTGAGDAFTAAVAWALAAGRPLADAVRLAAAAGALATTSDGARGPLDPAEVTRLAGLG